MTWYARLGFEAHGRRYETGDALDDLDEATIAYLIRLGVVSEDPDVEPLTPAVETPSPSGRPRRSRRARAVQAADAPASPASGVH